MKILDILNEGKNVSGILTKAAKGAIAELKDMVKQEQEVLDEIRDYSIVEEILFNHLEEVDPEGSGEDDPNFKTKFDDMVEKIKSKFK